MDTRVNSSSIVRGCNWTTGVQAPRVYKVFENKLVHLLSLEDLLNLHVRARVNDARRLVNLSSFVPRASYFRSPGSALSNFARGKEVTRGEVKFHECHFASVGWFRPSFSNSCLSTGAYFRNGNRAHGFTDGSSHNRMPAHLINGRNTLMNPFSPDYRSPDSFPARSKPSPLCAFRIHDIIAICALRASSHPFRSIRSAAADGIGRRCLVPLTLLSPRLDSLAHRFSKLREPVGAAYS